MNRERNVWAWLALASMLILLAGLSWFALSQKYDDDIAMSQERAQQELNLVKTFVANGLQAGRYQDAETLLRTWGESNTNVTSLQLIAQNGFIIASYLRPVAYRHNYTLESPLTYAYDGQARLRLQIGIDNTYHKFNSLLLTWIAIFAAFSLLLVALTYFTLRTYRANHLLRAQRREIHTIDSALAASEERLRLALDAGKMGSFDWDVASGRIVWTEEHARIFGITPAEFDGSYAAFARQVHPEDLPRVEQAVADAQRERTFYQADFRVLLPDGATRWVSGRGKFFYNASGAALRMLGVVVDITERKHAEQFSVEGEQRLRDLINSLFVYVGMMTPQGILTEANLPPLQQAGLTPADVIGKAFPDCPWWSYSTEVQARLWNAIHRAAAGEAVRYEERARMLSQYIVVDLALIPMRDAQGKVTHIIPSGVDITERKLAETGLRNLTAQLEQRVAARTAELAEKNRELETFTYSVSHDLKAPLRGIDGYGRLLLSDYASQLDEQGQFFVRTIREATAQMGQLIDDLLAYSRLERRELRSSALDPVHLIERLVAERRADIEGRHIRITLDLSCGTVYAEGEGLALALRNLLDNALKFTREVAQAHITIGASVQGAICRFWVRDNGPGFDMQYHDRIFEIFQRLHRAEEFPGTGIGLAIVRKAVQRMHGRAWAESQPGAGATFFLELPTTEEAYAATA